MQSALPARFPLADTKCTLSRAPDQEREIERTEKIICLQPAHASDCCGCCRPRLGLVRREGDAQRGGNPSARTHNRGCCDGDHGFSPFRFNLAIRTSLSLSCARTLLSFSFFFVCGIACAFVFDFVYPLSFDRGEAAPERSPQHRHTWNAQRMQIFRVRTGPVSLSMDQHKGTAQPNCKLHRNALSRSPSLVCCASRAQFSLAATFGRSSSPSFGKVEEGRTTELSFLVSFRHSDSRTDRVNTRFVLYRCSKRFLYYRCIVLLLFWVVDFTEKFGHVVREDSPGFYGKRCLEKKKKSHIFRFSCKFRFFVQVQPTTKWPKIVQEGRILKWFLNFSLRKNYTQK